MSNVAMDLRIVVRSLRRRRTFAIVGIGTIALGIGAATTLFTVLDGVVLRPLPFSDADRLVAIWQTRPEWKKQPVLSGKWDEVALSIPQVVELSRVHGPFASVGAWSEMNAMTTGPAGVELARVTRATSSLLPLLQVKPIIGRGFEEREDAPGQPGVALISYAHWQSRYGGRSSVVGSVLRIDDQPVTIVGVLPPGLTLDRREDALQTSRGGLSASSVWIPIGQDSASYYDRDRYNYTTVARLDAISTVEAAMAAATSVLSAPAARGERGTRVASWQSDVNRHARGPVVLLFAAAFLLLVIACVNVALLSVVEGRSQERELAIRAAIGAERNDLLWRLFLQSALLALVGFVAGVSLAVGGLKLLAAIAPATILGLASVHLNAVAVSFAFVCTLATTVVFGALPAVRGSRPDLGELLRAGAGQSARGSERVQRVLIATQLGLSVVLLIEAALFARSAWRIGSVESGFEPRRLLAVQVTVPRALWSDTAVTHRGYARAIAAIGELPGVEGITAASQPPFVGGMSRGLIRLEQEGPRGGNVAMRPVQQRVVIPGFFRAMGIPRSAGREFTEGDNSSAERVVVVSEALVTRDFVGRRAVGERIYVLGELRTIVGVVSDVHMSSLTTDIEPTVYTPFTQGRSFVLTLLVRTADAPLRWVDQIRRAVNTEAPQFALGAITLAETAVRQSYATERFRAQLVSLFGVVAVALTTVGVYGVISRSATRREKEVAIRRALGASKISIVIAVAKPPLFGAAVGTGIGLLIALVVSSRISPYLFKTQPNDAASYGSVLLLVTAIAVVVSALATRRALNRNLTIALRDN